jgi:hypothetical protein
MAALSSNERAEVWADAMRELSEQRSSVGIVRADLRAAVDALDTFLNDNASAINTAIPQPARGALTPAQKALLLNYVIRRRYQVGA